MFKKYASRNEIPLTSSHNFVKSKNMEFDDHNTILSVSTFERNKELTNWEPLTPPPPKKKKPHQKNPIENIKIVNTLQPKPTIDLNPIHTRSNSLKSSNNKIHHERICRICLLLINKNLNKRLLTHPMPGYIETRNKSYLDAFIECTGFAVGLEEPQEICKLCAVELVSAYKFIERCRKTQEQVESWFESTEKNEEKKVKKIKVQHEEIMETIKREDVETKTESEANSKKVTSSGSNDDCKNERDDTNVSPLNTHTKNHCILVNASKDNVTVKKTIHPNIKIEIRSKDYQKTIVVQKRVEKLERFDTKAVELCSKMQPSMSELFK